MYTTSDIRKGLKIEIDGDPWIVTDFQFVKPGKGVAFTKTKIKHMIRGNTRDVTYRTGEKLTPAEMEELHMSYLYKDGSDYCFMDTSTYDQISLPEENLGNAPLFLLENMEVDILFFKGEAIGITPPIFVKLEVTATEPGLRGDTAAGATKPATLETGHVVFVPLFVEQGQILKIDTRTGEYVERTKRD
jgi:elongation factor P